MLDLLLIVVFACHLLLTNIASAGPFVCLWLQWRESRSGDAYYGRVGRRLAWTSMTALLVATLLGGVSLGLVYHVKGDAFFRAARQIPMSRYWFGAAEWLFYFVCMWGYQRLWSARSAPVRSRRFWLIGLLAVIAGTELAYHFPLLFSVISMLGLRPLVSDEPQRFGSLILHGEVLAFWLHYLLASAAVTGALLMLVARRRSWSTTLDEAHRLALWGGRLALVATLAQLLSGVLLLVETPPAVRDRLLGGDTVTTLAFALAIMAAVGLMHRLAAVSFGETSPSETRSAVLLMVAVVVLMTGAHHASRQAIYERAQAAYVDHRITPSAPQHSH